MLIEAGGMQTANSRVSPGVKLEHVDYEAVLDELHHAELRAGQLDGEMSQPSLSPDAEMVVQAVQQVQHVHGQREGGGDELAAVPSSTTQVVTSQATSSTTQLTSILRSNTKVRR